jgi:hypothetical protein
LYPVIALPPLLAGATQFALTEVPDTDVVTDVGAPGVLGTVTAEKFAGNDFPSELRAFI